MMTEYEQDNPICRICLAGNAYCISIVQSLGSTYEPSMHEMISECIRYKVELNDALPRKICLKCAEDVKIAYRFKKRAEESYKDLCRLYRKQVDDIAHNSEKATQTDNNAYPLEIRRCNFSNPVEIRTQPKTEHVSFGRKCHFCSKSFELSRELKGHLIKEHRDEYIATHLQCQICERKFSRKDHLQRHIRNIHKMDPKSLCKTIDCVEVFNEAEWNDKNVQNLRMNTDTEMESDSQGMKIDSIFQKDIKEEIDDDENFVTPAWTENPENVFTKIETFSYNSENNDYEENPPVANEIKPEYGNYPNELHYNELCISNMFSMDAIVYKRKHDNRCEICQRIFSRHCHLRRHMKSAHTNEKPHACQHCDKRFTRSDHLKTHVVNVHEIKVNKCNKCDKAFVKNEALLRHKEVWHNEAAEDRTMRNTQFCEKQRFSHTQTAA